MQDEKPKPIIIGSNSNINYAMIKSFAQQNMLVYKDIETEEITSRPPLDKVFTINNYKTDLDYKSGRELRRERRKQQRKTR